MATLRGEPVDRPAVNFYEIGGFIVDPDNPVESNVYNSPDWQPLLRLAEEHTDIIRMCRLRQVPAGDNCRDDFFKADRYFEDGSRFDKTTLTVAGRTMTALSRRDPGVDTIWHLEHLLKSDEDLRAYLALPDECFACEPDVPDLEAQEAGLGDRGIAMIDTGDPMCASASLFSMEDYTIIAMTEQALFHELLDKHARVLHQLAEGAAKRFPGRLWRIVGPEYASEPYLPPTLFEEYVTRYTGPMVESIQKHGGFARIHSHGRLQNILPHILKMNPMGLDPVEPPPQGDMELADIRRECGRELVLFGNLEATDIENMETSEF